MESRASDSPKRGFNKSVKKQDRKSPVCWLAIYRHCLQVNCDACALEVFTQGPYVCVQVAKFYEVMACVHTHATAHSLYHCSSYRELLPVRSARCLHFLILKTRKCALWIRNKHHSEEQHPPQRIASYLVLQEENHCL